MERMLLGDAQSRWAENLTFWNACAWAKMATEYLTNTPWDQQGSLDEYPGWGPVASRGLPCVRTLQAEPWTGEVARTRDGVFLLTVNIGTVSINVQ